MLNLSIGLTLVSIPFYIGAVIYILTGMKRKDYDMMQLGYLCLIFASVFMLAGSIISLIIS